jgi:hypothetical protein
MSAPRRAELVMGPRWSLAVHDDSRAAQRDPASAHYLRQLVQGGGSVNDARRKSRKTRTRLLTCLRLW